MTRAEPSECVQRQNDRQKDGKVPAEMALHPGNGEWRMSRMLVLCTGVLFNKSRPCPEYKHASSLTQRVKLTLAETPSLDRSCELWTLFFVESLR